MKFTILILFTSIASMALASPARLPFITKTNHSGFVHPDFQRAETCEVFENKIHIRKLFGQKMVLDQEIPVKISKLENLVNAALSEPVVKKDSQICDAPETDTIATKLNGKTFTLFSTGACGNPSQLRDGPASQALRDLVDTYCPLTHVIDEP
jgi:hypothetical protein